MIAVLGFELHEATRLLEAQGYLVEAMEVKSRKGVLGNEARVIRQRLKAQGTIELLYAVFKTDYDYEGG